MIIQGTGKARRMKAGKVYKVGNETGNYLISKGFAVLVGAEQKNEDSGKVIRGTVAIKPVEQVKVETEQEILQKQIAAKTNQFKAATDKAEKRKLRQEINELKSKVSE